MPIYFQIEGIEGNATQEEHSRWMVIQTLNWDLRRDIVTLAGNAANREGSEPRLNSLTLTKVTDVSSVKLLQHACTVKKGKTAKIHIVSSGNPGETYVDYELTNAIIDFYQVSTSGERPSETFSLNFTKFKVRYTPSNEMNESGDPLSVTYDLASTKSS